MGNLKKESGITLIALVISIIVLLILAGVSISMLTGENGILKRAGEASEKTKIATEEEQRELARYEAAMNLENMEYEDAKGEKATIPAGFAPTRIEGESLISEGLVITDSEGNEFVWIPCKYSIGDGGSEIVYNQNGDNCDNRNTEWKSSQWKYNGGTWYDEQPHTIGKNSVEKYNGFYVARYEAGIPKNASFYAKDSNNYKYVDQQQKNNIEDIKDLKPVSKKGEQVWNYISQINAKKVASNMIETSEVKSYLIDSHAWNTVCRIIEEKDKEAIKNSKNWGNYKNNDTIKYEKIKGLWIKHYLNSSIWSHDTKYSNTGIFKNNGDYIELATGICEEFKKYNIYDMAGNMYEWTTEIGSAPSDNAISEVANCYDKYDSGDTSHAVSKGGSFFNEIRDYMVSWTNGDPVASDAYVDCSFRVVLYLK